MRAKTKPAIMLGHPVFCFDCNTGILDRIPKIRNVTNFSQVRILTTAVSYSTTSRRYSAITGKQNITVLLNDKYEIKESLEIAHPETPKQIPSKFVQRKRLESVKDVNINGITNESDLKAELEPYRNGSLLLAKPPYSLGALVKYYFIENKIATATNKEIFDYLTLIPYYGSMNKFRLQIQIGAVLRTNDRIFNSDFHEYGKWNYLQSPFRVQIEKEKSLEGVEHLSYNKLKNDKTEHEIQWNAGGKTFDLEEYKFQLYTKKHNNGTIYRYAECRKCDSLYKLLRRRNWTVNGIKYDKPQIKMLKFTDENRVRGSPKYPGGQPHFCGQSYEIMLAFSEESIKKRIKSGEKLINELSKTLEEKYFKATEDFDIDNLKESLKSLIYNLEKIHRYHEKQKLGFLYGLFKDGKLDYFGVTTDYERRLQTHLDYNEDSVNIEMRIAPIGKRNILFVEDLEAALIQLAKTSVLDKAKELTNERNGRYTSKYMKNKIDAQSPETLEAFSQLIALIEESDIRVCKTGKNSTARAIVSAKKRLKRNRSTREVLPIPRNIPYDQPTHESQNSSIFDTRKELDELIEKQSIIHKYNESQIPYFLYFLILPGTKIVQRYGISYEPKRRKQEHIQSEIIDNNWEMILAPLGDQSENFVLDLEGALIRLSRKKLLNDGMENANDKRDYGYFSSVYSNLEEIVENEKHERRDRLIKALNQLIALTFEKGTKV